MEFGGLALWLWQQLALFGVPSMRQPDLPAKIKCFDTGVLLLLLATELPMALPLGGLIPHSPFAPMAKESNG